MQGTNADVEPTGLVIYTQASMSGGLAMGENIVGDEVRGLTAQASKSLVEEGKMLLRTRWGLQVEK